MPRIPDWYLDSIIYLYPCETDAKAGKKAGGTGFLVGNYRSYGQADHVTY